MAFVIGVSQSALQVYSKICGNLIYDSLLHVSITRQKEKLYFRLENTYDDIYKRISKNNQCKFEVDTACFNFKNNCVKLSDCCSLIPLTSLEVILKNVIGQPSQQSRIDEIEKKKLIVDMGDHNIRFSSMLSNIIVFIINRELINSKDNVKRQFFAILSKLSRVSRQSVPTPKQYHKILRDNMDDSIQKVIPVIKYTVDSRTDYTKYYTIIRENIHNIKKKLRKMTSGIKYFCPLESVILYYMIECFENGKYQKITIDDIYNIIDTYDKAFTLSASGHEHCICKTHFCDKNYDMQIAQNNSIKKYQEYICGHYEQLGRVCAILEKFVSSNPNLNWLYSYPVTFECKPDFKIRKSYILIGYNEKTVFIFTLKPQFNDINFNEECINQVFDTWLCLNTQNEKFAGKNIVSCVLSLDQQELYEKDWTSIVRTNKSFLSSELYDIVYDMFRINHENYFNTFINIMKTEKNMEIMIADCKRQLTKKTAIYIVDFIKYLENRIEEWENEAVPEFLKYLGPTDNPQFIKTLDKKLEGYLAVFKYLSI